MKIKWISTLNEESGDWSRLFESIFKRLGGKRVVDLPKAKLIEIS